MKRYFIYMLLAIMCICGAKAQSREVCGILQMYEKIRVSNVAIVATKSNQTVKSDSLGRFCIQVDKRDMLVVDDEIFGKATLRITKKTPTSGNIIRLNNKVSEEQIEMAVGYGFINPNDKLYAIDCANNFSEYSFYTDIYELIQSKCGGVTVENDCIKIRGSEYCALLVVDGRPVNSINYITPTEVQSVSVLKDGSAAVYGTQGANGVVIITTKRGKE